MKIAQSSKIPKSLKRSDERKNKGYPNFLVSINGLRFNWKLTKLTSNTEWQVPKTWVKSTVLYHQTDETCIAYQFNWLTVGWQIPNGKHKQSKGVDPRGDFEFLKAEIGWNNWKSGEFQDNADKVSIQLHTPNRTRGRVTVRNPTERSIRSVNCLFTIVAFPLKENRGSLSWPRNAFSSRFDRFSKVRPFTDLKYIRVDLCTLSLALPPLTAPNASNRNHVNRCHLAGLREEKQSASVDSRWSRAAHRLRNTVSQRACSGLNENWTELKRIEWYF